MKKTKLKAFIGLIFATVFWGMSYIFSKELIEAEMNNVTIIFFRSFIASVCLGSIVLIRKRFKLIKKEHIKTMVLLSFFQPFLYFIFELYSMKYNSATLTSLIISLVPLFIPFALFLTERIKVEVKSIIAIIISIIGVSIMLLSGSGTTSDLTTNPLGIVLALSAMLCAVTYSIIAKKITKHYDALIITTYQNVLGLIFFSPMFLFKEYGNMGEIPLNQSTITSLLLLGVFCSAFAYLLYLNSIKYLGVVISTLTNNISPIFTVIGAFFIFGERLYPLQILGIIITVSSLFIGKKSSNKIDKEC